MQLNLTADMPLRKLADIVCYIAKNPNLTHKMIDFYTDMRYHRNNNALIII